MYLLKKCYRKALSKWTPNTETEYLMKDEMEKHLTVLNEIILHSKKGQHPQEELITLWIKDIKCNTEVYQHIEQLQLDGMLDL